MDKELRSVVLKDMEDENEMDTFFDDANEVTILNRGKISELEFYLSKFEKKNKPSPSAPPLLSTHLCYDLSYLARFQSQVGSLSDLPNSSKFTYLIGQLRTEALKQSRLYFPPNKTTTS